MNRDDSTRSADIRKRVRVFGRVQGVYYRQSCASEAERWRVRGWVRNVPDGTVEAVLEGPPERVGQMLVWMRQGPPRGIVDRLEVTDETPEGETRFRIR